MSPEQQLQLREAFALFDKDGDGLIYGVDMGVVLRSTGANVSDDEVHRCLKDTGAKIDCPMFLKHAETLLKGTNPEKDLIKAFRLFDRDDSGTISASELKHVLLNLSDRLSADDVEKIILSGDANGDGKIRYKEFAQMLLA
ncbi:MAG: uncharacterized protein KVP18_003018 [Porospora cf. gigantea A]|uniref:uncharacterized protein n=1 Tax=Porospora cf. gigantea A TaxID=2853593 RepID=UPI00355AC249|nr:MAG: hypothetical protein KVP18_003018 [Porospora cf. gigantea A]